MLHFKENATSQSDGVYNICIYLYRRFKRNLKVHCWFHGCKKCEYELRPLSGFKILLNGTLTPSVKAVNMSGEV